MDIKVFRKRDVFGLCAVEDEKPEAVFCDVSAVQITKSHIFGNRNGEAIVIKMDHVNYNYHIS